MTAKVKGKYIDMEKIKIEKTVSGKHSLLYIMLFKFNYSDALCQNIRVLY